MIDWFNLAANTLWILGCAIAIATISHASWTASLQHETLRKIMALPSYQITINIAGILFCLGLAGTSNKWWEIMLWLIITALFTGQLVGKIINHKK